MNDSNSELPMITWFFTLPSNFEVRIKYKTNAKVNIPLNYKVLKFVGQDLPCFLSH